MENTYIEIKEQTIKTKTLYAIINIAPICSLSSPASGTPGLTFLKHFNTHVSTPKKLTEITRKLNKNKVNYSIVKEITFDD